MHVDGFVRGRGRFVVTPFVATEERTSRAYPLLLTTGRILTQYNVGAQTRRTPNVAWHPEDVLEIHPSDAELRGIADGARVQLASRVGSTTLAADVTDRVPPGVVYTTFHHPVTGANVVTTEHSDWATNCPEYKVTAVEVTVAEHAVPEPLSMQGPAGFRAGNGLETRPVRPKRANELAREFAHLGPDAATAAVVDHITRFWDPRMIESLDPTDPALLPAAAAAAQALRVRSP
jgi:predicted molibdopterin-dependent oxidoreductase YjgC